ncbi:hypothetical protein EX30DRAFT_329320 [Ascodesmis nigricans]|uniref:C2 domain protein n=1 Tax=Ascodesmis nigricans TaxID=341454 RepID=A0A4S2N263_9PEZI|nr:hypothetical protein EX30DRAFT_329320 [Ascodesmis nigricans]
MPNEVYSGAHPIPRISEYVKDVAHRQSEQERHDQELAQQLARQRAQNQQDQDDRGHHGKKDKHSRNSSIDTASTKDVRKELKHGDGREGNRRVVTDPTTGQEIEIEDVTDEMYKSAAGKQKLNVPNASLPQYQGKIHAHDFAQPTQSRDEYAEKQDVTAPPEPTKPRTTTDVPIRGEKTNILLHPTPTLSLEDTVFASFEQKVGGLCVGILTVIVVLGKVLAGAGLVSSVFIGCIVAGCVWYWAQGVMKEARTVDWESEKKRGETAINNLIPESVEWMNHLLGIVWGLVNPDMLSGTADMLEDILQASSPNIIQNIRVADISQGSNPIRIVSMRALPDSQVLDLKKAATAARDGRDEEQRKAEEDGGEVYNLEIAFAYNAAPIDSKAVSGRTRNMHMELVFYTGIKGLVGVPLPIWVELKGLVGTVRLRLHVTPDPPYVKTLTFSLMGIPKVSVSCIPMVEKGINVLDLPMISNFVNAGIATACNEYTAPKSMSLELGKMLMGDDVKKETEAVGILWVDIKKAIGLSKQDRRGSSDAYITIAFSKYGKPMYSTRVIVDDLNPIWNEQTAILVNAEHIKANEGLSIELWDSDRFTADDCVGKVEIPIQKLMENPGKQHDQVSTLKGEGADSTMPGELYWSVGFYYKPDLRPALRTHGKDVNLPDSLKNNPALQDDKGSLDTEQEAAIMHTPPDPLYPSGIISVVVHQIVNLEIRDQSGSYGRRKGKEYSPGMVTGESKQEQGGKLPSSYCTISINDELVYRTRTKVVSSKPIFNAGTERFLRDWRSGMVTVAVRDSRNREHDPLLGVVPLNLSQLLQTSSGVTRWFPLDAGLGFGQIRLTVFFRSLDIQLPPQLQGWDVGTFEFLSDSISSNLTKFKSAKLKFRTGGSTGKIPAKNHHSPHNNNEHEAPKLEMPEGTTIQWSTKVGKHQRKLRLPVKHRYMSPITIDIVPVGSRKPAAHAMLWLRDLVDHEAQTITIPIWETNNSKRLTQNCIYGPGDHPEVEVKEIGTFTFTCRFSPGMDRSHERFVSDNDSRETFEVWEACKHDGVRGDTVKKELNPVVEALHNQSIQQMRTDLAETEKKRFLSDDDKQRFTDKYGKSWEKVFQDAREQIKGENVHLQPEWPLRRELPKGFYNNDVSDSDYSYSDDDNSDSETSYSDDDDSENSYQHIKHAGSSDEATDETGRKTTQDKKSGIGAVKQYRMNQKDLHRQHRGLMQWKPVRGLVFAKDEAKYGVRKMKRKMALKGREPDVETEA